MKYYVFILMSLLLVCCYNKPETQEQKVNIIQEFKRTNKLCISIEYKQPINGYTVKVICSPYDCYDKERDTEIWGKALLCFEKDNRCFYIYNDSYSDSLLFYENKTPIKDGMVLYLDYLPKRADEYLRQNKQLHQVIKTSMEPIQNLFNIQIPNSELAYLVEILSDYT